MKRFLGFVRKEFLHIFRDIRTLIIIFGIPAAQILIFGYAVSTDLKDAKIAILDNSKDEISREITGKLVSSEFFQLEANLNSFQEVDEFLKKGNIKAVVVFENNLGKGLIKEGQGNINIITDASEPTTARLVAAYAESIIRDYQVKKFGTGFLPIKVQANVRMYYNPALEGAYMFVPGVITLILMLICALMTSVTITREKEFGTMEVLLVSPLKPIHIILGKVIPYLLLSIVNMVIILLMANFVFDLPVKGSLTLLMLESILYITLALSLGITISTVSSNMQQAMFISLIGLLLPSLLLSGFIFPIDNMPIAYHYISLIMPPRWFIIILKNIMVKGTGIMFVWKETLILLGMTLFFIGISAKKFKIRLE